MQQSNMVRPFAAWRGGFILFPALALVFSAGAPASDPRCSDPAGIATGAEPRAGQVAVVDPDTGELLIKPLPPGLQPAPDAPDSVPTEEWPDGTVVADPGNRLRARLVAEVIDGKLVTCHLPPDETDSHMQAKEGGRN